MVNCLNKNVFLLIAGVGLFLVVGPMGYSLLQVLPNSPYIPDGWYSRGVIDYVNPKTGDYYFVVMPKSESGVALTGAQLKFNEVDVSIPVPFKQIVENNFDYSWYQYWYETDLFSDGLSFNVNYSITWTVFDEQNRVATVSDWILFKPLELPLPEGYFTFDNMQYFDEKIVLEDPTVVIKFVPTLNTHLINGVSVDVSKDGELVETIPTIDVPGYYPQFVQQENGTWIATYDLPFDGTYLLECYVQTDERILQLESALLEYSSDNMFQLDGELVTYLGFGLTAFGSASYVVMSRKEGKK